LERGTQGANIVASTPAADPTPQASSAVKSKSGNGDGSGKGKSSSEAPRNRPAGSVLTILNGDERITIDEQDVWECGGKGCPLSDFVKLDPEGAWCVTADGKTGQVNTEMLLETQLKARNSGGVKIFPKGRRSSTLFRAPALIEPCQ
jgi:hypothetical protein